MQGDLAAIVGKVLGGRYRVLRPIGAGGMGAVFEAEQLDLGRRVAVKVLLDLEGRSIARLRQEATSAGSLQSPHVVTILDFQMNEGEPPFIVMELLPGESLATLLRRERPLEPIRAVRIASQMLVGLDVAHRAGITHRDIKPSNVWLVRSLDGDEHVKLLDFGIAKVPEDSGGVRTTTGAILGTPSYLAPEQVRGWPADPRSDLHAVGVVLFEMLTGTKPWSTVGPGLFMEILERRPPPVQAIVPSIPASVSNVVERALSKDPAARFASAIEMRVALMAEMGTGGSSIPARGPLAEGTRIDPRSSFMVAPTGPAGAQAPAKGRALVFLLATTIVLLLGVIALGVVMLVSRHHEPSTTSVADGGVLLVAAMDDAADGEDGADGGGVAASEPEDAGDAARPASTMSAARVQRPRKPDSDKCECLTPGQYVRRLCLTPITTCECKSARRDQMCAVPFVHEDDRVTCPGRMHFAFGGASPKQGGPCHGWEWDSANQRSVETDGRLDCIFCQGHKQYPGFHGQRCRGIDVDGEWLDGEWRCPGK